MWAEHTAWQQQQDDKQPVTLKAEDTIGMVSLTLSDQISNLMQTSSPDFVVIFFALQLSFIKINK